MPAWRDVTPQHNALVDALVQCELHLIVTMRSKTAYDVQTDSRGKLKPVKIGLAPVQRDGLEYEFDVVADIDVDHNLIVGKTRCRALDGLVVSKPDGEVAQKISEWLTDGVEPVKSNGQPPEKQQEVDPGPTLLPIELQEKVRSFVQTCEQKLLYHDPETGEAWPIKLHPFGKNTAKFLASKWQEALKDHKVEGVSVEDMYHKSLGWLFFGVQSANDLSAAEGAAMFRVLFNGKPDELGWDSEVLDVARKELLAVYERAVK